MTSEKNFRISVSKKEILDSLILMHIEDSDVILWQNHNGVRHVKRARIEAIDFATSTLILSPQKSAKLENFKEFNSDITLYFIGENKNIVFKQVEAVKIIGSDKVRVAIPAEVRLLEKRIEQRLIFNSLNEKTTGKIYTGGRTDIAMSPTIIDVSDVSLSGMGFYLPKKNARFFYEKDKIKIDRIGNHRFDRPINGIIVYIIDEKRSGTHLKVGLRFVEKLDEEVVANFK
jgi:hypothetical protein